MLKKFGMEDCKPMNTPMATGTKLNSDEKGKVVDQKLYKGIISSLLYLTTSRPDILFSVCLCARFQSCPKESHIIAVKRIFGTTDLGLWYPKGSLLELAGYSNVDFAGGKTDRKSTSGISSKKRKNPEAPSSVPPKQAKKNMNFAEEEEEIPLMQFETLPSDMMPIFRNDPDFGGLEVWFEKTNLMGLANYSEELVSPNLVREFYANIAHDITELNIYADPALESEPREDFDQDEAWKIISGREKSCPSNAFNRFIRRPDVKMLHQFVSRTIRKLSKGLTKFCKGSAGDKEEAHKIANEIKTFWEGVLEAATLAKKAMDINEYEETDKEKDNELKKMLALSDDEATSKEKDMQARALKQLKKELIEKQKQAEMAKRKQGDVVELVQPTTYTQKTAETKVIHSSFTDAQRFAEEDPKFAKTLKKIVEDFAELINTDSPRGGRKYKRAASRQGWKPMTRSQKDSDNPSHVVSPTKSPKQKSLAAKKKHMVDIDEEDEAIPDVEGRKKRKLKRNLHQGEVPFRSHPMNQRMEKNDA
ncbi:hypothetical protein CCACVL1_24874 [Corchorus capsularis]|uniref:Uncharacterized protein n=1 Tax=Corchorus capsularis TaxID=210143 RepID=A0A1R3GMN4_COCAP|nr:hypothetical protein CCACVL1_24874 [Corchorus capsularis]